MIESKIAELFQTIENSLEYQNYHKLKQAVSHNPAITQKIQAIKKLQQEATNLEYHHDDSYKELDKIKDQELSNLNKITLYQEFLNAKQELEELLKMSSTMIESYFQDKVL